MFFRVHSTISVGGARALDEVHTSIAPSTQSSSVEKKKLSTNAFTFMHLADAFIQSDLQCIQAIHFFFLSVCVFPGN